MSHHVREDKTCLNCGALVPERFCTHCGQENLEPTESLGHLVRHFFEDITHFDGKLFLTIKDLIAKPGFLTREYVAGRRMKYLNPIRMYIFISAMFFLAVFAGSERSTTHPNNPAKIKPDAESVTLSMSNEGKVVIDIVENKYNTLHQYDSIQQTLHQSSRDKEMSPWLERSCVRQKEKHNGQSQIHIEVDVQHDIPKIMFLLLPLFALYVGWFYSRKKYFYVNHAIFSVHYHCFLFLLFLLVIGLSKLIRGDIASITLGLLSLILSFIYLVAALRGMYQQSFWRSLGKGIAISALYIVTMCIANTLLMVSAFIGL